MRIVRIAEIATLAVAVSLLFLASTPLAELLPSDSTVTFVVDKRVGMGDFTTITAAINQVKANADASPSKPYRVLIVPSPTPYNECINLSGLRYTELAGVGGTPRIDYSGSSSSSCPFGADVVGCYDPSQGCKSVTLRNISVAHVELGTIFSATALGAAYDDLTLKDLIVQGAPGAVESLLRLGPCLDTSAPYQCSFLVDGAQVISPAGRPAYIEVFDVNTQRDVVMSGRVKGSIVNSYLHSDICPEKTAIVRFAGLNATRDSHLLFEGNTVVCEDMMATAGSEGTSLLGASNGYGWIQIIGNQFVQTIPTDRCGPASCFHSVFKADHASVTPSEIFLQDNTVRVILKAAGLALDKLYFIDIGPTTKIVNQNWYVSGNDFKVIVDGGDFNPLNARDIRHTNGCAFDLVCDPLIENNIVYIRDQELRYGIQIDPESQGQVLPWPTTPMLAEEAWVRQELKAPLLASSVAPSVDGAMWVDPSINRICYRSGGDSRCLTGCGDGVCAGSENKCTCSADCGAPPTLESSCSDGVDNNCDGLMDAQDPACAEVASIVFPNEDNFTVEWWPKTPRLAPPNPTRNFDEVNDFTDSDNSWVELISGPFPQITQTDNYRLESASNMAADHRTTEVTVEVVARGEGPLRSSDALQVRIELFARGTTQGVSQTVSLPRDTTYRTYLFTSASWNAMGLTRTELDDMTAAMRGTVTKNTSTQRDARIRATSVKVNVKSKRP